MTDFLKVIEYSHKIRLGNKGDGGYVVANIPDYDCYISAGVGWDESFSNDIIKHFNINEAHAFDGTIDTLPTNFPQRMNVYKFNIASYKSKNTVNLRRFINDHNNIFLKMDIEGGEYEWLNSLTYEDLNKFKQIAIEFHFINDNYLGIDYNLKQNCLKKLFETHYIVHIHGNNNCGTTNLMPNVIEITYIRKDIIGNDIIYNTSPLPDAELDFPNIMDRPDIDLNFYPFVCINK
jgi:hypothetical protein